MRNPIEQYYKYAQLAQASYGLFTGHEITRLLKYLKVTVIKKPSGE